MRTQIIREIMSTLSPTYTTKFLYKRVFKRKLNLENPKTLNEKVLWLKLNTYASSDLIKSCADKYKVRAYIEQIGEGSILNNLLGVWNDPSEINWDKLPSRFVLKCNHGAGYNIICKDKNQLNKDVAVSQLKKWLNEDYWKISAEINYRNIDKKIIAEEYIEADSGSSLVDYKFYCFNGKANCVMLCVGREQDDTKFYYFNRDWVMLPYSSDALQNPNLKLAKPEGVNEMFELADKLSKPFPFVRVDFYYNKGKIIFGELTFTPGAGLDNERLEKTDIALGNLLDVTQKMEDKI